VKKSDALMISEAAARFGLSRATLLYYDRIGVCGPWAKNAAGYRLYGEEDIQRLSLVVDLRRAGIPLKRIAAAMRSGGAAMAGLILARLGEINEAIEDLRQRQENAISFLEKVAAKAGLGIRDFEAVLLEAGLDASKRVSWHERFGIVSPRAHEKLVDFLRRKALDQASVTPPRSDGKVPGP
jgi:DNA-binding transcriptional MerR regulator